MHVLSCVDPDYQLEAFLHDAHEVYSPFGDVRRPDRVFFPFIDEIELSIDKAICERFGTTIERLRSPAVKLADDRVLATEYRDLRWPCDDDCMSDLPEPLPSKITPIPPGQAMDRMLKEWAIELGIWE